MDESKSRLQIEKLNITTTPRMCAHCRNNTPMRIICEGEISEVSLPRPFDWPEEPIANHKWEILACPVCDKVNILEISNYYCEEEIVGVDIQGDPIFDTPDRISRIFPQVDLSIPEPHVDLPHEVGDDYIEAYRIFNRSPRGASALLRLAIQKLCKALGESGKDINSDIAKLVKKGMPSHIQQALDIVRVIGNFAVHPGELDIRDNPEIAKQLFSLINEIVEDRISKMKKHDRILTLYTNLPQDKLDAIKNRDK